jgi:hypothetical protein
VAEFSILSLYSSSLLDKIVKDFTNGTYVYIDCISKLNTFDLLDISISISLFFKKSEFLRLEFWRYKSGLSDFADQSSPLVI